jgi:hypothetical protein
MNPTRSHSNPAIFMEKIAVPPIIIFRKMKRESEWAQRRCAAVVPAG